MTQQHTGASLPLRLETIEAIATQIPESLWAVWLLVERDNGKQGKVPHQLKGKNLYPIKHSDKTQWVSFAEARRWYESGKASGIGLLIGSNPEGEGQSLYSSGLVALDIDNCLDETGELSVDVGIDIRSAVKALLDAGIYIEVSPSGKGLRALWIGGKPEGIGERWDSFGISGELYDGKSTRFVTVTGQVWKDAKPLLSSPDQELCLDIVEWLGLSPHQQTKQSNGTSKRDLPKLSDEEVIRKLKQSSQGKGKKLFDGDMSDYAGDHSSSDLALCRMIAKWTDDPAQVATVWQVSALGKREKFKRKDYRQRTIQEALSSAREAANQYSKGNADKSTRLLAAIEEGDSGGILALALASWGGKVPATLGAAETILSFDKRLAGAFALDAFSSQILKLRSLHDCLGDMVPPDQAPIAGQTWADSDTSAITVWLERAWAVSLKSGLVDEAINLSARGRVINTVVDMLDSLAWDRKPRLSNMLVEWFNADDSNDSLRYLSAIGRAWMIGTVARAYEPGCKHDHILTLEGRQGFGKSNAVKALASAIAPHTYREGLPALSQGQEAEIALCGTWVCELAELAFMDKATTEHIKAFITRTSDSFRPKYAKHSVTVRRTVSFAATTNQGQFVRDATGARRFWVFRIRKPIDIGELSKVAHQLWAEAVQAFKNNESWWLTDPTILRDAESSQGRRLERDWLDEVIAGKLIEPLMEGKLGDASDFDMQALDIWRLISGLGDSELSRHGRLFADALIRAGFERRQSGGRSMWKAGCDLIGLISQAKNA